MSVKPGSLTFRLSISSFVWVTAALLITGSLLVYLFHDHIQRRFDDELRDHMEELVTAAQISGDGKLQLQWHPSDTRFKRPLSGWYWQIKSQGKNLFHSKSLWDQDLQFTQVKGTTGPRISQAIGPADEKIRIYSQTISLPDSRQKYVFSIAGPVSNIQNAVGHFTWQIVITLTILALFLILTIAVQVRFGLQPLSKLRKDIAKIRSGELPNLQEDVPDEVTPVVEEINALLDHNSTMLAKARAQAANLAHALKNPLTVMRNEAAMLDDERGRILQDQSLIITRNIERHLARAQAAGSDSTSTAHTLVAPVVDDLLFSMQLLHKSRNLEFSTRLENGISFSGDTQDLEEMLGNLLDNAGKWAKHKVDIIGNINNGQLQLIVQDDGPGIDDKHIDQITKRGRRLDETVAGSGLGLDIISDIAEIYKGSLNLSRSGLGGLKAILTLPGSRR